MKKHLLPLAILLFFFSNLNAQHFVRAIKCKTHYVTTEVQSMGTQGSLVSGVYSDSATALLYFTIIRYDNQSRLMWAKEFGPKKYTIEYDVRPTSDGNFIASYMTPDDTCIVLKLNGNGGVVWSKSFKFDKNFGVRSVRELSNSNYLIAGVYDASFTETDAFQVQLNSNNGNLIYFKGFRCVQAVEANVRDVIETADHNLLMVGNMYYPTFEHDIFLLKTSLTGTVLWSKKISIDTAGIIPLHVYEFNGGTTLKITTNNQYLLDGNNDAFVITTDGSGNFQSAKGIDIAASSLNISGSSPTADGGMLFVGSDYSSNGILSVKMDANGNPGFTKLYNLGLTEFGHSVAELDGGDLLLGTTLGEITWNRGGGLLDMALFRTDAGGDLSCFTSNSSATTFNRTFATSAITFVDTVVGSLLPGSFTTFSVYIDSALCGAFPSGINEVEERVAFSLYPNPVSSVLMITASENMQEVKVMDAIGKEILHSEISNLTTFTLHTANLAAGIYFVQIKAGDRYSTKRFIKE